MPMKHLLIGIFIKLISNQNKIHDTYHIKCGNKALNLNINPKNIYNYDNKFSICKSRYK